MQCVKNVHEDVGLQRVLFFWFGFWFWFWFQRAMQNFRQQHLVSWQEALQSGVNKLCLNINPNPNPDLTLWPFDPRVWSWWHPTLLQHMWLRHQSGASAKSCGTWLQCMEAFSGSCWLRRLPVCPVYTGGWAAGTWYLVQAPVVSLWGMCWIYQWTSLANTWMIMQKDSFRQPCGCLRQWLVQNRRWLALSHSGTGSWRPLIDSPCLHLVTKDSFHS